MTEYDNNMRGVLFRNEDKESDKHPDYKGQGEVDRKPVWISAWIKTSKKGSKFMSLSFQYKTAQQGGSPNRQERPAPMPDPDEPF
jgi:uncharacterized protein (DUF736 family)